MNIFTRFIYSTKLYYFIEYVDYTLFLRLGKYLPVKLVETLSRLRGNLRYFLDLDWKSAALGYPVIRENTLRAVKLINAALPCKKIVRERFIHQSREEFESILFSSKSQKWPRTVEYENIQHILEIQEKGHGLILLTAHFDSSIAGSAFIGSLGYNVNMFYDEIVYDDKVPLFLRNFFRDKYKTIQSHFNKGIFLSKKNLMEIHHRLAGGEILIWLYDVLLNLPGTIDIEFLNKHYKAPESALKMALLTKSYIGAYITIWMGNGRYKTIFLKPVLPSETKYPEFIIKEYYAFISKHITKAPERWWIADALITFTEAPRNE